MAKTKIGEGEDPVAASDANFEHDPRYRISLREMWISVAYWVCFTAISMTLAWSLGHRDDGAEQPFVLGFPAWFFWSTLGFVFIASFIVPYLMVRFSFNNMSLEPDEDGLNEPGGKPQHLGEQR